MCSKAIVTITKRSDFIYLKKHGKKIRSSLLSIVYAKSLLESNSTKVSYIASKKTVGNAVKRNKVKRRFRSLVREYYNVLPSNYLILFIASPRTYNANYSLLKDNFLQCISHLVITLK
ncbi:MAG: ribonuclease P protein component [Alphaproteobacteria bacterium]|nr:ribonuclease P protein component [Alphaproteobacteria bacterium]